MPRKALVNTKRNVLMPPGHPIILLKSNLFNVAAVSVKEIYWSFESENVPLLSFCGETRTVTPSFLIVFIARYGYTKNMS